MPDDALEAAYRATDYIVEDSSGPLCIRIGEPRSGIEAQSWAYVTACNPRSKLLPQGENARRLQDLERVIAELGFRFLHGEALARDGNWPAEPSLLILDIDEKAAIKLGRRFDQAAIVFGRRGESARLVWIDDCSPSDSA
jgi:hypothetical protein